MRACVEQPGADVLMARVFTALVTASHVSRVATATSTSRWLLAVYMKRDGRWQLTAGNPTRVPVNTVISGRRISSMPCS